MLRGHSTRSNQRGHARGNTGEAAEEKVDRLPRQMDAIQNEIRELTQARQQAADAMAAFAKSWRRE